MFYNIDVVRIEQETLCLTLLGKEKEVIFKANLVQSDYILSAVKAEASKAIEAYLNDLIKHDFYINQTQDYLDESIYKQALIDKSNHFLLWIDAMPNHNDFENIIKKINSYIESHYSLIITHDTVVTYDKPSPNFPLKEVTDYLVTSKELPRDWSLTGQDVLVLNNALNHINLINGDDMSWVLSVLDENIQVDSHSNRLATKGFVVLGNYFFIDEAYAVDFYNKTKNTNFHHFYEIVEANGGWENSNSYYHEWN